MPTLTARLDKVSRGITHPAMRKFFPLVCVVALLALLLPACGGGTGTTSLTLYTDRNSTEIGNLFDAFAKANNIQIKVRTGSTAELTAALMEEGKKSPADLVYLESGGALSLLAKQGVLGQLPADLLAKVDKPFAAPDGSWVGATGRVRTVVYNTDQIDPAKDLPPSILGFTDPKWKGKIGWAPAHGETQGFLTALRAQLGDEATLAFLKGLQANQPKTYSNNIAITQAVATGEVSAGLVNHYYVYRLGQGNPGYKAKNYYFLNGAPGSFVDVSAVGITSTSGQRAAALKFIGYLLSPTAQQYYADNIFEFPLAKGAPQPKDVPSLASLQPPQIDLATLTDTKGTIELMRKAGVLS